MRPSPPMVMVAVVGLLLGVPSCRAWSANLVVGSTMSIVWAMRLRAPAVTRPIPAPMSAARVSLVVVVVVFCCRVRRNLEMKVNG